MNIGLNLESSCNGCEKRHVGCHSHCEAYAEFRRRVAEARKAEKEASMKTEYARHIPKRRR